MKNHKNLTEYLYKKVYNNYDGYIAVFWSIHFKLITFKNMDGMALNKSLELRKKNKKPKTRSVVLDYFVSRGFVQSPSPDNQYSSDN